MGSMATGLLVDSAYREKRFVGLRQERELLCSLFGPNLDMGVS